MAKIYFNLIKAKVINPKTGRFYIIDDVPEKYKEAVEEMLASLNGE